MVMTKGAKKGCGGGRLKNRLRIKVRSVLRGGVGYDHANNKKANQISMKYV